MKKYFTITNIVKTCIAILVLNILVMTILLITTDGDQFVKADVVTKFIKMQLWLTAVSFCIVWGRLIYSLLSDLRE